MLFGFACLLVCRKKKEGVFLSHVVTSLIELELTTTEIWPSAF